MLICALSQRTLLLCFCGRHRSGKRGRPRMACLLEWQSEQATLHAFSNADCAADRQSRKSVSAGMVLHGKHPCYACSSEVTGWAQRHVPPMWQDQLGSGFAWTQVAHRLSQVGRVLAGRRTLRFSTSGCRKPSRAGS